MEHFCPTCKKTRHTESKFLVCKETDKKSGYDLNSSNLQGRMVVFPVQICHTCGTLFVPR